MTETPVDWAELYRENVAAVTALAHDLTDDQLAAVVPATPEWTVSELLAHLSGVAHDFANERLDGAPGAEWTGRHVGERRGNTPRELTEELGRHRDSIAASVTDNPRPAVVWNIAVHHADLHEALGLGRVPASYWRDVLEAMRSRVPEELSGVDDYELFRALFSRRSRGQVRGWSGALTEEAIDELGLFGPRDDDQPVPAQE